MIRQSIACDICGAEKKETKHWFVALEQGGELRICSWSAGRKTRSGEKHLCGQTCLHRLVDDFMAGTISGRVPASYEEEASSNGGKGIAETESTDEYESSARLIPTAGTKLVPAQKSKHAPRPLPATGSYPAGPYAASTALQPDQLRNGSLALEPECIPSRFSLPLPPQTEVPSIPPPDFQPPDPKRSTVTRTPFASVTRQGMQLAPSQKDAHREAAPNSSLEPSLQRRRAEAWERERARDSGQRVG